MRLGHVQLAILGEHMKFEDCVTTFHMGKNLERLVSFSEFKSSVKRLKALGLIRESAGEMAHKLTHKGLFEYLRNGGGTMDQDGMNVFRLFLERNANFLDGYGEKESEFIEKCLILGFSPRFSEKTALQG